MGAAPALANPVGEREFPVSVGIGAAAGADAAGNFVVVVPTTVLADNDVVGKRFDAAGTLLSAFQANASTTSARRREPAVAVDPSGSFVVVWTSNPGDGDESGILARRFDAAGAPLSGDVQVNTYTTGSQLGPAAAPLAAGGFVVVWQSYGQDGRPVVGISVSMKAGCPPPR